MKRIFREKNSIYSFRENAINQMLLGILINSSSTKDTVAGWLMLKEWCSYIQYFYKTDFEMKIEKRKRS